MSIEWITWAKTLKEDTETLVLDVESSGGSKLDEIISLGIVRLNDGEVLFNSLIKPSPTTTFNWYATKVHGITPAQLADKPTMSEVHTELYELLHGKTVLAFNYSSDKRMLEQTFNKHNLEVPSIVWECVMRAYKAYSQRHTPTNLTAACKEMNVKAEITMLWKML